MAALPQPHHDDAGTATDNSTDTLPSGNELRGPVLEVVRSLIADNGGDAILEIVRRLVSENADMSRRLARIAARQEGLIVGAKAWFTYTPGALDRTLT